jgi:hypothetical protein
MTTKLDLKARQAFGEQLTPAQVDIINNDTYPNDYELTPWEALTEAQQEDKVIADLHKGGDARAKQAQQNIHKTPTYYR